MAAEYELYRRLAPKMFGICLRYGGTEREAEDIMQNGFMRLFAKLDQFRFDSSIETWGKKIFINAAIDWYRKNLKFSRETELQEEITHLHNDESDLPDLSAEELLLLIQKLPPGYRAVFNLYVIENFEHREIAGMLGISEGTSKSQLSRAKA